MSDSNAKKTKYFKRIIAIAAMLFSLFISLAFLQKYLCIPYSFDQNRAIMIHKEPKNSIDVLFIGSSATYSGFSSVYAYEKYGFTSFPYAIGGSTCTSWKPAVQDVLATQNPKLIVVDVFGGGYDLDLIETRNNQFYTIMSHMPLSNDKVYTAEYLSKNVNGTSEFSLLFPIAKYHNSIPRNLKSLGDTWTAFHSSPSPLKGVEVITRTRKLKNVEEISFSEDAVPLDKKTESIIRDFIDYCKENELNLLFVKYPTVLTENDPDELLVNLKANRILEIANESGFATLNMQKQFHDIGLIETQDYYNHGHTNTRGQKKITAFLGDYICNNLHIESSKLDGQTADDWNRSILYYNAYCELCEELISQGKSVSLGDCPELIADLEQIINGESVKTIADKYHEE